MVRLESLSISYRAGGGIVPAVAGVDASLEAGSVTALIGPSGCGKTSLVKALAGLVPPASGRVLIGGRELAGIRDRTSVIFQDYGLLPWKTVEANAELPLLLRGLPARERRERVRPVLEELGLSEFGRFYPARLSGGMRQRLAVARALAAEPDLLLMDEPFSSLDALTRESLQETLLAIQRAHRATVVLVTHSIEEAVYLSDTVLVMRGRNPGAVAARFEIEGGADRGGFRARPRFQELSTAVRAALAGGEG